MKVVIDDPRLIPVRSKVEVVPAHKEAEAAAQAQAWVEAVQERKEAEAVQEVVPAIPTKEAVVHNIPVVLLQKKRITFRMKMKNNRPLLKTEIRDFNLARIFSSIENNL